MTNKTMFEMAKTENIQRVSCKLQDTTYTRRLNWLGHILRREVVKNVNCFTVLHWTPENGSPQRRFVWYTYV